MSCGLACFLYYSLGIIGAGIILKIYLTLTSGKHKIKRSLKGKVVVITGGTAGIGKETVLELATHGATVHVLARDLQKAERFIGEIRESTCSKDIHIHHVDLSDFASVRAFAKKFLDTGSPLHVLINNAGMANVVKKMTVDGNEETTQANHLSHFLLTNLLLDRLTQTAPSRVVNVASVAHRFVKTKEFDVRDINFNNQFNKWEGFKAYCWSKLMNVLFTRDLARRLRATGVTVNCLHPGGVCTELFRSNAWRNPMIIVTWLMGPLLKSAREGAQTSLYLAEAQAVENVTGQYFANCAPSSISLLAADDRLASDLWKESEKLTGLKRD